MDKAETKLVMDIFMPKIMLAKVRHHKGGSPDAMELVGNKPAIDMTDQAIKCVFEWFTRMLEDKNNPAKNNYSITFPKKSKYTLWMLPTEIFEDILEKRMNKKTLRNKEKKNDNT